MSKPGDIRRGILSVLALAVLIFASACAPSAERTAAGSPSNARSASSAPASTSVAGSAAATAQADSDDSYADPADAYESLLPKGQSVGRAQPERQAILDALRPLVQKGLHQSVKFEVYTIQSAGQFAGVVARAVRPNGDRVDYSHTQYQEMIDQQAFDEHLIALLKHVGGRWRVLKYELGATDYVGGAWLYKYRVPADVFGN